MELKPSDYSGIVQQNATIDGLIIDVGLLGPTHTEKWVSKAKTEFS
jgi:hypothetical protein